MDTLMNSIYTTVDGSLPTFNNVILSGRISENWQWGEFCVNPLTAQLSNLNLHSIELQVSGNYLNFVKLGDEHLMMLLVENIPPPPLQSGYLGDNKKNKHDFSHGGILTITAVN